MAIKESALETRNQLQQGIYKVIDPVVKKMIDMGITPNIVTTIGFLGNLAAAIIIACVGYIAIGGDINYFLVFLSGLLVILFSLFDMLDGQVARIGNMASTFGAMYDSVLDRYCELFTLGGITYYLLCAGNPVGAIITLLALVGSIMVSYVRARGEGLGVVCKIGFMQRPERVVVTALALLVTGIAGMCGAENANIILIIAMAFIAIFANVTAVARINYCRKALTQK